MEERNIRIVFFDIDGTTYEAEHEYVSPSTIKAVNELHDKGIYTVICTGRGRNELLGIHNDLLGLPFDAFITSGGSEVFMRDGTRLFRSYIDVESAKRIKELLATADFDIDCIFTDGKGSGVTCTPRECGKINFDWFHIPTYPIRDFDESTLIHAILCVHKEYHSQILTFLHGTSFMVTSPFSVEAYPRHTTKATGIKVLLKHFGLTMENVVAFGDSDNDVEMLKEAGVGICMANGSENAKKSSDYVCDDIYHDGIYNALKKYGVI